MNRWTTSVLEIKGINTHYLRTGRDNPPLVLLHGLMTNGSCWTDLARKLEDDYDVIMPDARGHGHSSTPNQGDCYYNLANDVILLKLLIFNTSYYWVILLLKRSKEDVFAEIKRRQSHRSHELIELLLQARFQTSLHAFEILTPPNPNYRELINTLSIPSLLIIGGEGAVISPIMAEEVLIPI